MIIDLTTEQAKKIGSGAKLRNPRTNESFLMIPEQEYDEYETYKHQKAAKEELDRELEKGLESLNAGRNVKIDFDDFLKNVNEEKLEREVAKGFASLDAGLGTEFKLDDFLQECHDRHSNEQK